MFDSDVLNLAGSCDINVSIQRSAAMTSAARIPVPAIAAGAVAVILVLAGALVALSLRKDTVIYSANTNNVKDDTIAEPSPSIEKVEKPGDVVFENPTEQRRWQ